MEKEIFKINIHSFVDVITNSSTELFVANTEKSLEQVREIVYEMEKKWPDDHGHRFNVAMENPDYHYFDESAYVDTADAITHLTNRGYKVIKPKVEKEPEALIISIERGGIHPEMKKFIIETFNAKYFCNG
jgi:hypothetical protein